MAGFCSIARRLSNSTSARHLNIIKKSIYKRHFLNDQLESPVTLTRHYSSAYEGDGKTVGFVINKRTASVLCIESIQTDGFKLATGDSVVGSLLLLPHVMLSWHVTDVQHLTEESLVFFKLVEPKIDMVIFGYGAKVDFRPELKEKFSKVCKSIGIRFEFLPTEQACGVFNFLSAERRYVAGLFIPPRDVDPLKLDRSKNLMLDYDTDEEEEEEEEKVFEQITNVSKKPLTLPSSSPDKKGLLE